MHIGACGAYRGIFPLSLVSAGQAVVLLRVTHACGEFKKLSNQYKERGTVHGPLGHDALTPTREILSFDALDLEELKF